MTDHTTRAPACHLVYHDGGVPGDILLKDVYVPSDGANENTYFCCLSWNNGWDGQGYLGIQDHGNLCPLDVYVPSDGANENTYFCCLSWNNGWDGQGYLGIQDHGKGDRSYIYSLWNPRDKTLPLSKAAYTGLWSKVSRFGTEGYGIHMGNHAVGWEPDHWYTVATRCWENGDHTNFGYWVHNQTSKVWTHLVTFDYPVKNLTFHTATDSFMENFAGTGRADRKVRYGHGYKRSTDKTWHPLNTAHFHVNQGYRVKDWEHNYNAGVDYGYYYMETGEDIHPRTGLGVTADFQISLPPAPIKDPIEFQITQAMSNLVEWKVPESSTPQFRYTVTVNQHVASQIAPEVRSHRLIVDHPGSVVTVVIEDLLGNVVTKSAKIVA